MSLRRVDETPSAQGAQGGVHAHPADQKLVHVDHSHRAEALHRPSRHLQEQERTRHDQETRDRADSEMVRRLMRLGEAAGRVSSTPRAKAHSPLRSGAVAPRRGPVPKSSSSVGGAPPEAQRVKAPEVVMPSSEKAASVGGAPPPPSPPASSEVISPREAAPVGGRFGILAVHEPKELWKPPPVKIFCTDTEGSDGYHHLVRAMIHGVKLAESGMNCHATFKQVHTGDIGTIHASQRALEAATLPQNHCVDVLAGNRDLNGWRWILALLAPCILGPRWRELLPTVITWIADWNGACFSENFDATKMFESKTACPDYTTSENIDHPFHTSIESLKIILAVEVGDEEHAKLRAQHFLSTTAMVAHSVLVTHIYSLNPEQENSILKELCEKGTYFCEMGSLLHGAAMRLGLHFAENRNKLKNACVALYEKWKEHCMEQTECNAATGKCKYKEKIIVDARGLIDAIATSDEMLYAMDALQEIRNAMAVMYVNFHARDNTNMFKKYEEDGTMAVHAGLALEYGDVSLKKKKCATELQVGGKNVQEEFKDAAKRIQGFFRRIKCKSPCLSSKDEGHVGIILFGIMFMVSTEVAAADEKTEPGHWNPTIALDMIRLANHAGVPNPDQTVAKLNKTTHGLACGLQWSNGASEKPNGARFCAGSNFALMKEHGDVHIVEKGHQPSKWGEYVQSDDGSRIVSNTDTQYSPDSFRHQNATISVHSSSLDSKLKEDKGMGAAAHRGSSNDLSGMKKNFMKAVMVQVFKSYPNEDIFEAIPHIAEYQVKGKIVHNGQAYRIVVERRGEIGAKAFAIPENPEWNIPNVYVNHSIPLQLNCCYMQNAKTGSHASQTIQLEQVASPDVSSEDLDMHHKKFSEAIYTAFMNSENEVCTEFDLDLCKQEPTPFTLITTMRDGVSGMSWWFECFDVTEGKEKGKGKKSVTAECRFISVEKDKEMLQSSLTLSSSGCYWSK
jgi:hypothetical protein